MNKYLKYILVGVVVLALAGCGANNEIVTEENITTENEAVENIEKELVDAVTIENITDEQLQTFTGFEADYRMYLENKRTEVHFLKESESETLIAGTISIYPNPGEDATALYLYEVDGVVVSAKLDEFSGTVSSDWIDADYLYYSFSNMMVKQPSEESLGYTPELREAFENGLKDALVGQPLYKLHEKLNIYVPVHRYEMPGTTTKLNTYMIVSEVGYTASTDVNVIYNEEGTILEIYLDDSYGPGKLDPLKVLSEQQK